MKRVLLQIHLWIGLTLCIPFVLLGLTGSVLVYDQEIIAGGASLPRASGQGMPAGPAAILAAAAATHPELQTTMLTMPDQAGGPAIVRLMRAGERAGPGRIGTQVFVDPVTLQILDERAPQRSALVTFAHDMHSNLLIGMPDGRSYVGWLGVGMTFLGLSGIVMWWPRKGQWRRAYGIPKRARGFLFHRQLHATAGVSFWIVFVVVSFTGVAIAFPLTIGGWMGAKPQAPFPRVEAVAGAERIDADKAVAVALAAAPKARLSTLNVPAGANDAYRITLTGLDVPAGGPPITVSVDPYRARALQVRDARAGSAGDAALMWNRRIHAGDPLGGTGHVLVFVTGLLPALFSLTGVSMWLARRRARRTAAAGENVLEGAVAE